MLGLESLVGVGWRVLYYLNFFRGPHGGRNRERGVTWLCLNVEWWWAFFIYSSTLHYYIIRLLDTWMQSLHIDAYMPYLADMFNFSVHLFVCDWYKRNPLFLHRNSGSHRVHYLKSEQLRSTTKIETFNKLQGPNHSDLNTQCDLLGCSDESSGCVSNNSPESDTQTSTSLFVH